LTSAPNREPDEPTCDGTPRASTCPAPAASAADRRDRDPPAHADLAEWLLAREIASGSGGDNDELVLSAAAERVCQKLSLRLSKAVSPAGSQAIMSRAIHLARSDFPFLDGVRAGRPPDACLAGLPSHVRGQPRNVVLAGLQAVLGILLDLLVGFIGEDLTLRLLRELWPDEPVLPVVPEG
jgi:hypothetical protein